MVKRRGSRTGWHSAPAPRGRYALFCGGLSTDAALPSTRRPTYPGLQGKRLLHTLAHRCCGPCRDGDSITAAAVPATDWMRGRRLDAVLLDDYGADR
ncbi:hypothetical protein [Streptomyces sp. NPDC056323]|uniref:hypothetical protein n=1 Tax=Streptomyces sp. NPDC056323 TaxID=3345784 RepID=UPI0035DC3250